MSSTEVKKKKKKKNPMAKYERMKKLGLPMTAIVHKMKADGLAQAKIDSWAGVSASESDEKKSPEDVVRLAQLPSARMKPFHWTKVQRSAAGGTLWEGVADSLTTVPVDFSRLSAMFSATVRSTTAASSPRASKDVSVIDPKRCHTVMLGVKALGISQQEILDAIMDMDESVLPPDKVQALTPLAPTDGELAMLREYVKSGADIAVLNDAEKFFVLLFDLVGVRQMLRLWHAKMEFEPRVAHLRGNIKQVRDALAAMKNDSLCVVFKYILAIGNYLNSGSHRGDAHGFHLESLDLLDGLKASDKKTSLLAFVVSQLVEKEPGALQWLSDTRCVEDAARITSSGIQREVDELKRDLTELDKRINAHKRTMTKAHADWAKDGSVIGLQHLASHIRKESRSLPWDQVASYSTLRLPLAKAEADGLDMFQKSMYKFYKHAKTTVRDIETEVRGTEQLCRDVAHYFGADEDTSWEELFAKLAHFRQRFAKAQRELTAASKKSAAKKKSAKKAAALEQSLKMRAPDAAGKYQEPAAAPTHRRRGGGDDKAALAAYAKGSVEQPKGFEF